MNRRISPAIALTLLATALSLAAGVTAASAADAQARVRLYYLSPDGPHVDFYVDGARAWSDVTYKTVSTYTAVAAGQHHFQVRQAGSAAATQPLADVQQSVDANGYYTVFAGGKASDLKAGLFADGFPNPPAGKAVARFVHMAPEVPGVDVKLKDGTTLFSNIAFLQSSPYAPFPTGSYDVQLVGVNGNVAGQVLFSTQQGGMLAILTPDPATAAPQAAWKPAISDFPATMVAGHTHVLTGTQFNLVELGRLGRPQRKPVGLDAD